MDNWPTIDPGDLRNQISILQQTPSSDASGSTVTWGPFVTAWAKIDPVRGTDVLKSGQVTTQEFLVITMWYQPGILADMQVQAPNGLYVIQSVENLLEMDIVLRLNCLALGKNDA
jgi:SPP1 family predicted phage head-tail adaptor